MAGEAHFNMQNCVENTFLHVAKVLKIHIAPLPFHFSECLAQKDLLGKKTSDKIFKHKAMLETRRSQVFTEQRASREWRKCYCVPRLVGKLRAFL